MGGTFAVIQGDPSKNGAYENRDHYIVVWGPEGRGYHRCIVVSVLSDGPGGAYTLDVT
jgi:hypothetical protein